MTPVHCQRSSVVVFVLLFVAALPVHAEPPHKDCHGDPLPEGAIARMGTVRFRHADGICQVTYSSDGTQMATLGRDRTLRVWEAVTGKLLSCFRETDIDYYALTFAPDGKTLVAAGGDPYHGGNAALRFFDLTAGKEKKRLAGHAQPAYAVAFSKEGKTLVSVSSDQVICWDVATGNILHQWKHRTTAALAIAPDLKTLAWVDGENEDKTIHVADVATGKEIAKLTKGHKRAIVSVAYSPDGKHVASSNPFEPICLWDVASAKVVSRFEQQQSGMCLKFSADGKTLASGSMDGSVRLWDVKTTEELKSLTGYRGWVNGVTFSPDGKTLALAGADSQVVHRWEVATASALEAPDGHQGQVYALAFSPNGKILATGGGDWHDNDQNIHLWDVATGKELKRLTGHQGRIYCLQFSPDGKLLVSGSEKEVDFRVWDLQTGKEVRGWQRKTKEAAEGFEGRSSAVAFSQDGKWLASAHDQGTLLLWSVAAATEVRSFKGHEGLIHSIALSPGGKHLLSGGIDRTVRLWEAKTGKEVRRFGELADGVKCVAFSPDGRIVAASCGDYEGTIYLWDTENGRELGQLSPAKARIFQIAFSPDGKTLAGTGADNSLCVWEVSTRLVRHQFVGHPQGGLAIAFSPDGRKIASGGQDTTVLLWDVFATASREATRRPLDERELEQTWNDLASDNAKLARRAVCTLVSSPDQAMELLQKKLRPITALDAERLAKMLDDLDNDRFQIREKATSELARLGELAEPLLRKTMEAPPSLEVKRRVELLLVKLDKATLSAEQLRTLRAFEVLETIGGSDAQQMFEAHLQQGAAGRLGREAQACLQRLRRLER
jgi:WD40 repeat protein